MTERIKIQSLEELLSAFPPQEEIFDAGQKGRVAARVSRNSEGDIIFAVPGSTRWLEQGEQQESQITA